MEFKHTTGPWKVCEHSWSDSSITGSGQTICTISICDETTEETQEALGAEMDANFKLIAVAPEMLETIKMLLSLVKAQGANDEWLEVIEANRILKKATK
ncbi:MAG TPA: hypothetical protein VF476_01085 [Chitinophagaceae bacterium]